MRRWGTCKILAITFISFLFLTNGKPASSFLMTPAASLELLRLLYWLELWRDLDREELGMRLLLRLLEVDDFRRSVIAKCWSSGISKSNCSGSATFAIPPHRFIFTERLQTKCLSSFGCTVFLRPQVWVLVRGRLHQRRVELDGCW